jgi:hypothetical protein
MTQQRILVCGGRTWGNYRLVLEALKLHVRGPDTVVIEGEASGADRLGAQAGRELGLEVLPYPADWTRHGRSAGMIRNREMLTHGKPTIALAFHADLNQSKGTRNMIELCQKAGIPVVLYTGTEVKKL